MKVSEKMIKCVLKYAYKHRREIATMLRDGLNAYLEYVPKRKRRAKKTSKKEVDQVITSLGLDQILK